MPDPSSPYRWQHTEHDHPSPWNESNGDARSMVTSPSSSSFSRHPSPECHRPSSCTRFLGARQPQSTLRLLMALCTTADSISQNVHSDDFSQVFPFGESRNFKKWWGKANNALHEANCWRVLEQLGHIELHKRLRTKFLAKMSDSQESEENSCIKDAILEQIIQLLFLEAKIVQARTKMQAKKVRETGHASKLDYSIEVCADNTTRLFNVCMKYLLEQDKKKSEPSGAAFELEDKPEILISERSAQLSTIPEYLVSINGELGNVSGRIKLNRQGLQNRPGNLNCYLNVIVQSLRHLRRFYCEFLQKFEHHRHTPGGQCVICELHNVFIAMRMASLDPDIKLADPGILMEALSEMYPTSDVFKACLHISFAPSDDCRVKVKDEDSAVTLYSGGNKCISHDLFGLDIYQKVVCQHCGHESRKCHRALAFTLHVHATLLRKRKDEFVQKDLSNCDHEDGGCGRLNYILQFLANPPHYLVLVLDWEDRVTSTDILKTLEAITAGPVNLGGQYSNVGEEITPSKHVIVSMICYHSAHYICFIYNAEAEQWVMYDDERVEVIGNWHDVLGELTTLVSLPRMVFLEDEIGLLK